VRLAIETAHPALCFRTVRLRVRASNERAIRCYVRCGFEKASEFEKVRPTGKVETIHVMERAAH
jgi:ribosomal protein S18 acetylase RimI-like enzyme